MKLLLTIIHITEKQIQILINMIKSKIKEIQIVNYHLIIEQ